MEVYYCNPKSCDRKESCNHYLVEKQLRYDDTDILLAGVERDFIAEDLSDICLPEYRLFIFGDRYKAFNPKKYYQKLFWFFDHVCEGEQCQSYEAYGPQCPGYPASRIECKRGKEYTCKHEKHPINNSILDFLKFYEAEIKAFENAGIETGTVEFTCPVCGGKAIGNRYYSSQSGRLKGLGSHCQQCGLSHT